MRYLILIALLILGCEGPAGEIGPMGEQGPPSEPVVFEFSYTRARYDIWASTAAVTFDISELTHDVAETGSVIMHWQPKHKRDEGVWFALPYSVKPYTYWYSLSEGRVALNVHGDGILKLNRNALFEGRVRVVITH